MREDDGREPDRQTLVAAFDGVGLITRQPRLVGDALLDHDRRLPQPAADEQRARGVAAREVVGDDEDLAHPCPVPGRAPGAVGRPPGVLRRSMIPHA
jgi:hypothetical protein